MAQRKRIIGALGTHFHFNSDLSGDVAILQPITHGAVEINVPAADLVDFIAEHVRQERIQSLLQATSEELLGLQVRA